MSELKCDQDVYENGQCIVLIADSSRQEMDELCEYMAKVFQRKCDWSSYCGRYAFRTIVDDQEIIEEMQRVVVRKIKEANVMLYDIECNPVYGWSIKNGTLSLI